MADNYLYLITLGVVLLNIFIGHFFAPMGIILAPFVISIVTVLLAKLNDKMRFIKLTMLTLILIIINDLGLLFFAGGTLDNVGLGIHNLSLFVGYILSSIILTITCHIKYKESSNKIKFKSVLFSLIIFILYFAFKMFIAQYIVVEY